MAELKSYRAESKKDWGRSTEDPLSVEQLTLGCMLRIADATELMAKDRQDMLDKISRLEKDLTWYENQNQVLRDQLESVRRSRNAYKGKLAAALRKEANNER